LLGTVFVRFARHFFYEKTLGRSTDSPTQPSRRQVRTVTRPKDKFIHHWEMHSAQAPGYLIKCQGGYVPVSADNMDRLFAVMPMLRYLLLGYPGMKAADVPQTGDGMHVYLHIFTDVQAGGLIELSLHDDYQVSAKALTQLIAYILYEELPQYRDDQIRLVLLATRLGGCEQLAERVRQVNASEQEQANRAAMTPSTDTRGIFEWRTVGPQYSYMKLTPEDTEGLRAQGFEYVGHERFGGNGEDAEANMYYFRKPR